MQKSVSSACWSQDSHSRHWQRPKTSLSQQARRFVLGEAGVWKRNVGPHLRALKKHWQKRSRFPSLCRGHTVGLEQEGQRHLKSLTEGGFGCIVTFRTVQDFSYRKKKRVLWAKKRTLFDFFSTILYNGMWKLLIASTELYREVRRHYEGSLLC